MSAARADSSSKGAVRVGAIDIGTNTVLLLVAERREGKVAALCERATITRLGQGVDRTRELAADARQRTLSCLRDYAAVLGKLGVDQLHCVGTSAMRDARGGDQFAAEVAQVLGVRPRILSGDEEAELTFRGSLSGLDVAGPVSVFDIGGGSTEIIHGHRDAETTIASAVSLDVGSVRLFERHVVDDPPSPAALSSVQRDVREALARAPAFVAGATLVGVAGTVTTVAAVARHRKHDSALHGERLLATEIAHTARLLVSLTLAERLELTGIEPARADVIVVGAVLLAAIVERAGASAIVVSDRGVRWGLAEASLAESRVLDSSAALGK